MEEIDQLESKLATIKTQLRETDRHLLWKDLPEKDRFTRAPAGRKRLLDTVRMIAYRAETALCSLLGEQGVESAAARRMLQDLFTTEADIVPDQAKQRLTVRVHRSARPAVDRTLEKLFENLNELETTFPSTERVMHYELLGSTDPKQKKWRQRIFTEVRSPEPAIRRAFPFSCLAQTTNSSGVKPRGERIVSLSVCATTTYCRWWMSIPSLMTSAFASVCSCDVGVGVWF